MSAAMTILPVVQAMAVATDMVGEGRARWRETGPEMAFYRKYTENLLRRYVRLSMESGRVPSMMGQEMFPGRVTTYRVRSFEDAVIFVVDVERCLRQLGETEQVLIKRIALQEYTQSETATLLRMGLRTVVRRYAAAMDELTSTFLSAGLLVPMVACQGARAYD